MNNNLIMKAKEAQSSYSSLIVAAKINGEIRDIQTPVSDSDTIEFVEINSSQGWMIYRRSVLFLLITSLNQIEKNAEVIAKFTVNKGLYCEIKLPNRTIDASFIQEIDRQMRKMIALNLPIVKHYIPRQDAIDPFQKLGRKGK